MKSAWQCRTDRKRFDYFKRRIKHVEEFQLFLAFPVILKDFEMTFQFSFLNDSYISEG